MSTNKDDGQNNQQDPSKQLEPVEPSVVPSEHDIQAESRMDLYLKAYTTLLGQALMFMLQQDAQNLRLIVNQAHTILNEAIDAEFDDTDILIMQFMTNIISIFEPMQRSMGFMIEGRFETAAKEFKKTSETCFANATELEALNDSADPMQNEIKAYLIPFFQLFGGWMAGLEGNCLAEIVGYQGRTREYTQMLRQTVEVLRQAVTVAPLGSPPELVQLSFLCGKTADQLEARAEAFEKNMESKRYIEATGNNVFIVHGHDEAKWRELSDLLKEEFKLSVVVLKEKVGNTRHIIQKFEDYAMDSCFAFVILTPDDFVYKKEAKYLQARPNVLFEMGWFYGRFGPSNICILKKNGTEIPSDLEGISTIEFRDNIQEVSLPIRKELRQVGLTD